MIMVEPSTLFQLGLAVASLIIWAIVYWRGRAVIFGTRDTRTWLSALAVGVLVASEFIPFTVGWTVFGDVDVADVLRGIRSGVVLIVGLAFLSVGPPTLPRGR